MDFCKQIIDGSHSKGEKTDNNSNSLKKEQKTVKHIWHWDVKDAVYFSFVLLIMQMKIYEYVVYTLNELELSIERHTVQTYQTHG